MGSEKKRIALFASGTGTNAENICYYFREHEHISVELICSNNAKAGVFDRCKDYYVPYLVLEGKEHLEKTAFIEQLKAFDLIVLVGFLWRIPKKMVNALNGKLVNLHPSLLPKFGGKGMYGSNVHKAVIDAKASQSGITVHYVNEAFDDGEILFQAECQVDEEDDWKDLAEKIHQLEMNYLPEVIEDLLS